MAHYGYERPSITSPLKGNSKFQAMEDHLQHQQEVLQLLKDNFVTSNNRMKQRADQHRNEASFEEGD